MPYRVLVDGGIRKANPQVLNLGLGVDSSALLAGLVDRGRVMGAVVFAAVGDFRELGEGSTAEDVARVGLSFDAEGRPKGDEHPETYEHLVKLDAWLRRQPFWPGITVITYEHMGDRYSGLRQNCIANQTLPSISFGRHSCSLKHKGQGIDRWVLSNFPEAPTIRRLVGFDAGSRDTKRACRTFATAKNARFQWCYPLQSWGWDRERCEQECLSAWGYLPRKSSCYFCAAMKPAEVFDLARQHPRHAAAALEMEAVALPRLRNKTIGLSGAARVGRKRKDGSWVSKPRPGRWTDLLAQVGRNREPINAD